MEKDLRAWTLGEVAAMVDGELHGPADLVVRSPASAGEGGPESLTFAGTDAFLRKVEGSSVGAVIVGAKMSSTKPYIRVANPKQGFGEFLTHCVRALPLPVGVHPSAVVDPRAHIDPTASIGALAVIEQDAFVGPGCKVYPFCYVGDHCRLEADVVLFPHVVLYQDVRIGARTIVHSGAVLGADGFSYAWDGWHHVKVPQVGRVTIGGDCEIGAMTAIDRAMLGETAIGDGTKIDNLVQIAHNVSVGKHAVIASQTGVAGSSKIGSLAVLGGQVGIGDHLEIGDGVTLAARTGASENVQKPGAYMGYPVMKLGVGQRVLVLIRRLPELAKRLRDVEKRLDDLESGKP